jgi:CRP/FNR family transcriptional regulator
MSGEVECADCGLDPMCQVLDYAEPGSGLPEGLLLRRQPIAAGEALFRAGQVCDRIYAVKSGSFKGVAVEPNGRERVVGFYFAGELIGTEGIAGQHYTSSVRALEAGQVCHLRLDQLHDSGRSVEQIQTALIAMLGSEVALNQQLTSSLIRQSAEQRMAAFLLSLSDRYQRRGLSSLVFSMRMSRSDIASYLGIARETVSRILTKFQNEGLIRLKKNIFQLKDRAGLDNIPSTGG